MADNIQQIKQLTSRYWQGFVSFVTAILAFIKVYYDFSNGSSTIQIVVTIGVALFVIIIIRFPKVAFTLTRWILGKPELPPNLQIFRGPRPYFEGDKLPGRQAELDTCWQLFQSSHFFILQGESGSGKSSFLNANLKPKIFEKFRVVECRIIDDPFNRLVSAFLQKPFITSQELSNTESLLEAITSAQSNYSNSIDKSDVNRQIVLIIDQSEELFVNVKDEVRSQLLDCLKKAIIKGQIRVVLAIRNDFLDLLLTLCRNIDPKQQVYNLGNFFELLAFSEKKGRPVLDEMLEPLHGGDPLKKQQLDNFSDKLIIELLRPPRDRRIFQGDEKSILPVELQITGMMIEFLGIQRVIDSGIENFGGKIGLLRSYVESAKNYVWRKTGVEGDKSLLILRQLVSPARTKWAQTPENISRNIGVSVDQVTSVLNAFGDQYLVKLLPVSTGNDIDSNEGLNFLQYELMHEHLVRVLIEAPQQILQKARDAEERLQFWNKRTEVIFATEKAKRSKNLTSKLQSLFAQPIPISETMSLWQFATRQEDRRILKKNIKGFIARILSFSLPVIMFIAGSIFWAHTDKYFITSVISKAPIDEFAVSSNSSDIGLITDWAKALANIDNIDGAFSAITKVKSDQYRSDAYVEIALHLTLIGNLSLADSALIRAINIDGIEWKEIHKQATLSLSEMMAKNNKEQVLYTQILAIKEKKLQLNALISFMKGLFKSGKQNDGERIFNEIVLRIKNQNDLKFKISTFSAIIDNAVEGNRKEMAETGLKIILSDTSLRTTYNYFETLLNITLYYLKINDLTEALNAWKAALLIKRTSWTEGILNPIVEIIKEASKNEKENDFYNATLSGNFKVSYERDILQSVAVGMLIIEDNKNEIDTSLKRILKPVEIFTCYSAAIDTLIKHDRFSDAKLLISKVLQNSIPPIAICRYNLSLFDDNSIRFYRFLTSLIKLKDYNTAIATALKNDCDISNNIDNYYSVSPLSFVLIGMAKNGKYEDAYASSKDIKNPLERNYVLAVIAVERLKANQIEEANQMINEVIEYAVNSRNASDSRDDPFTSRRLEWKDNEYPISYIALEAAKLNRVDISLKLCNNLSNNAKNLSLSRIAVIFANANRIDSLNKIINAITSLQLKSQTFSNVVVSLADSNKNNAMLFVSKIQNPDDISKAKAEIAKYEARNKNFQQASQVADSCFPRDKLDASTVILNEFAIKKNPKLKDIILPKEKKTLVYDEY